MIIFITGGSRGIGAATALEAIRRGHDVAFTYHTRTAEAEHLVARAREIDPARTCRAYQLDVRDSAAVEEVGDRVLDELGTVDGVIANAGIYRLGMAAMLSDEDWHAVLDTNLSGAFYVCRQFLPTFVANGRGRFVMISSLAQGGASGLVSYAVSKSGLIGLSGTLAREYGSRGITSNVILPGLVDTEMTRDDMPEAARQFWQQFCPVGGICAPEDVVNLILYLILEAPSFINGAAIPISGGLEWAP